MENTTIFTFRITLMGSNPEVTRTFKMSADGSLYELHHILQVVMGWKNYHLYQFEMGKSLFADSRMWDEDEMDPITDVKETALADVFTKPGTRAMYEYDFGDGWMHLVELVERSETNVTEPLPVVISVENACPPEDCGGLHGYANLLEILQNPKHPEYKEMRMWAGTAFNPTKFNLDACNKELTKLQKYIKEYEAGF